MNFSPGNPEFSRLVRSLLADGLQVQFKAGGNSMRPWIRDGDLLTLGPVETAGLKRGQIIAFETATGALMVHRLVGIGANPNGVALTTRGDANLSNDPPHPVALVVGRVIEVRRNGRRLRPESRMCWWLSAFRRVWRAVWCRLS